MGSRSCVECGASKRMLVEPPEETVCAICRGDERHPYDVLIEAAHPVSRFRFMPGVYNTPEQLGPGQSRVK